MFGKDGVCFWSDDAAAVGQTGVVERRSSGDVERVRVCAGGEERVDGVRAAVGGGDVGGRVSEKIGLVGVFAQSKSSTNRVGGALGGGVVHGLASRAARADLQATVGSPVVASEAEGILGMATAGDGGGRLRLPRALDRAATVEVVEGGEVLGVGGAELEADVRLRGVEGAGARGGRRRRRRGRATRVPAGGSRDAVVSAAEGTLANLVRAGGARAEPEDATARLAPRHGDVRATRAVAERCATDETKRLSSDASVKSRRASALARGARWFYPFPIRADTKPIRG